MQTWTGVLGVTPALLGKDVPGFALGKITEIVSTADLSADQRPETPNADPLLALVVFMVAIESVVAFFAVVVANRAWWAILATLIVIGLAFLVPDRKDAGGGFLANVVGRPFEPIRWLFTRFAVVLYPERGTARKLPRVEYKLKSEDGTESLFVIKGNVKPSVAINKQVVIWTSKKQSRPYLRAGWVIEADAPQPRQLQFHRSYNGRYALALYILLHLGPLIAWQVIRVT
jgi:hypothetical protein